MSAQQVGDTLSVFINGKKVNCFFFMLIIQFLAEAANILASFLSQFPPIASLKASLYFITGEAKCDGFLGEGSVGLSKCFYIYIV